MIVYSLLFLTIAISLLSHVLVWRGMKITRRWDLTLLAVALNVFIFFYGAWIFLSIYLKYLSILIFVLVALAATFDTGKPANSIRNRNAILPLFLSAVLLTLIVLYFTGTTGKPRTVSLSLPFKKGKYFVFQGGKGLPTNVFHSAMRGTIYAMDIVKLNPMGGRAKHIFSKRLEDYEIFGDTVYSPCSGHIVFTRNDRPDNIPPYRAEGRGNLNGVLIETDSFYVYLGHFKQGSVMVKPGDFVTAGQPLALAGNSGFTLEPHLHIQAHQKTYSNIPWYREPPLFIRFNGRSYNLFEVINAQQ